MTTPDIGAILRKPKRPLRQVPPPESASTELVDDAPAVAPPAASPTVTGVDFAAHDSSPEEIPTPVRHGSPAGAGSNRRAYLQPITIYLPRSLYETLSQVATSQEISRTAVLLMAVNAVHSQLGQALEPPKPARTDLFDLPQARRVKTEQTVQTSIRVTDAQLQVLDDLAAKHGVTRTKLLVAAAQLHLR